MGTAAVDQDDVPRIRRTAESQRLMEDILRAATELFSRKGFLGTTTQELADAVGLIKGTLYYHIGSKDEVLYAIHQSVTEEGIRIWGEIAEDESEDSRALVRRMVVEHCRLIHRHLDAVAVFSEEMKFLPPRHLAKVLERRRVYQGLLEKVIRDGMGRGAFETKDPHVAALLVLGMLNAMYRWYRPEGPMSAAKVGEIMAGIVLDGVLGPR